MATPTIIAADTVPWETWRDAALAARSPIRWRDLLAASVARIAGFPLGIAEIPLRATLARHRHQVSELYYVLSGTGRLTVDGQAYALAADAAVDIPGGAEHALTNVGATPLIFIYVFPVDAFADLVYEFPAETSPDLGQ